MPRPKGPTKKPVLVRLLEPTWDNIEKQAKARNLAVPTFITVAIEAKFGSKS